MKQQLFTYGTLRDEKIQKEIIGRVIAGTPDVLEGYAKSQIEVKGGTYPIIIPDVNSSIAGHILLVTPEELERIDEYETDAYKREKVTLKSGETAWVYKK